MMTVTITSLRGNDNDSDNNDDDSPEEECGKGDTTEERHQGVRVKHWRAAVAVAVRGRGVQLVAEGDGHLDLHDTQYLHNVVCESRNRLLCRPGKMKLLMTMTVANNVHKVKL